MTRKTDEAMKLQAVGDEAFGFKVGEIRELSDMSGRMWRMEYVKNGAEVVWIETDDVNKTFAIAFRTLPDDDTGVAHIVEHSVLCGSEKFHVKEPFVELLKSSLGTFVNAWTAADCTVYPVSSCNDQDLFNLAEVYLDAVFAPRSVKNDWAMPQERNVVFNEMKGAMSSPNSIAAKELSRMLFPSNVFGHDSGGDPAVIPTLTKEKYCEFYNRFYHPSNARIFLYGKVHLLPLLKLLSSYLVRYERREVLPTSPFQLPVFAEKSVEYLCDTISDHSRVCEGWVFGTWHDIEKILAMNVVCSVLAGSNEAPLAKALLDAGVCDDLILQSYCGYQNQVRMTLVNVRDGKIDEARRIFRETLARLVREGFDESLIAAKLDRCEFVLRERGSFGPIGIVYLVASLRTWLYGGDPAERIEFSRHYDSLRRLNGTGYYERLAAETLLENPHHATLIMVPTDTLKTEDALPPDPAPKAPEDDPADLARIPRLRLADIPEKGDFTDWTVETVDGVEVVRPIVLQNGITYASLAFAVDDLTDEELLDLPLLGLVLGDVPSGGRDVLSLHRELDAHLGSFSSFEHASENGTYFHVGMKFLHSHAEESLRLVKDILFASDFSCTKLIDDIRNQWKVSFEVKLLNDGYSVACNRAARGISSASRVSEAFDGFSQYRHLKFGNCGDLAKLAEKIFVRGRLVVSIANPPSADFAHRLIGIVPEGGLIGQVRTAPVCGIAPSDSYTTKGQGAFTAMCARLPESIAYSGAFMVAAEILTLDYLWNEIRIKGGAYGGGFNVDRAGHLSLMSWRDPRPENTLGVFKKCGEALREYVKSGQSLEKYMVSIGGSLESNHCPALEAAIAFSNYLDGVTVADKQRWRSEVLRTTADDLLKFADALDQILPTATHCVIGEEALVRRCGLPEFKIENDLATSCGKGDGVV